MNATLFDYDPVSHMSDIETVDLSTEEGQARFHECMEMLKFIGRMTRGEID
jgi:hypothetical protein